MVGIKFDDGQQVEFTQEIDHIVLPPRYQPSSATSSPDPA
jgi:hypothetical protein